MNLAAVHFYPVHKVARICGDQNDDYVVHEVEKMMSDENPMLHGIVLSSTIDSSSEPESGFNMDNLLNDLLRAQK